MTFVDRCIPHLLLLAFAVGGTSVAFAQPINVKTYGATGNGVTDDTGAFNAALAAVPAGGGELYIPAGTYKLTAALSVTNKSIKLRGEGQRISNLRWDSATDGFVFSSTTNPHKTLTVTSLSFFRAVSSGGRAIAGSWLATPGDAFEYGLTTTTITDVLIAQEPYNNSLGWSYGIDLTNAIATRISNFAINGGELNVMADAIRFRGKSIAAYISAGDINRTGTGIGFLEDSEGLHVTDTEVVAAVNGIVVWTNGRPGTAIHGCHFNTTAVGIVLLNHGDMAVSNNLLYKLGQGNWIGIHVINGDSNRITNNYIVELTPGGPSNGIVLEGTSPRNSIQGNITEGMDVGIWLVNSSVSDNIIMGNLNRLFSVASVLNWGSGNYIVNNP